MKTDLTHIDKIINDIKTVYPNLSVAIGKGDRLLINGVILKGIIITDYFEKAHEINIKSILIEIENQYLSKKMKIYQKEYESYMKQVTDGFINMQSQTTTQEHLKDVMSQMLIIEWNGGLDWKAIKIEETFRDGNLMEENRKYNSEIAKKYLQSNTLTYDEWVEKHKTNLKLI